MTPLSAADSNYTQFEDFKQEAAVEKENWWKLKPSGESNTASNQLQNGHSNPAEQEQGINWRQDRRTENRGSVMYASNPAKNTLSSHGFDKNMPDIHNPGRIADQPTKVSYVYI